MVPADKNSGPKPSGSAWASAAEFGYNLLAGMLVLGGGGLFLDRKLGHSVPLLAIAGGSLAVATALYMLVKRVIRESDREMARYKALKPKDNPDAEERK